jgi:hypothetical protein
MHPHLMERLADARQREFQDAAGRPSEPKPSKRRPHRESARHRAGWLLVDLGLRLARGPGGA